MTMLLNPVEIKELANLINADHFLKTNSYIYDYCPETPRYNISEPLPKEPNNKANQLRIDETIKKFTLLMTNKKE